MVLGGTVWLTWAAMIGMTSTVNCWKCLWRFWARNVLINYERIEKRPRDTLAVDSHVPLVCGLVKSTHLIVEVDCSHVFVTFLQSGCTL